MKKFLETFYDCFVLVCILKEYCIMRAVGEPGGVEFAVFLQIPTYNIDHGHHPTVSMCMSAGQQ